MLDWLMSPAKGYRKWRAFLLVLTCFMVLVLAGKLTDQTLIRDVMVGLLLVFGGANAAAQFAQRKEQP